MEMLERMASNGTAPEDGCSIFGVGYEEAFSRIRNKYLIEQFSRGTSSEKFVVGYFGSGKTHFLRQLMEIARDIDCVTSEVELNKNIDFTDSRAVYGEVIRQLRVPFSRDHGVKLLIKSSLNKVKSLIQDDSVKEMEEHILRKWISGIDKIDLKLDLFGKVIKKALIAYIDENEAMLDLCFRWLEGDINDRSVSKELDVTKIDKSSNNLYAKRLMLSLFQFIKHAGFHGTVVGFDEAEQGLSVNKKKTEKILSMMMSGIEAITNLQGGSTLIVYALTPDLVEKMKTFPALQQRIINPRGRGFFDGNTLAPLIELATLWERNPLEDLYRIGRRLVDVTYDMYSDKIYHEKEEVMAVIDKIAREIDEQEFTSSNRRYMVKGTCLLLLDLIELGELNTSAAERQNFSCEPEV